MAAINLLVKPASGRCNMRCDYCFYYDEMGKRETASYGLMSEATLKNVIRRTLPRATGLFTLAFQGGEPTVRGLAFFEKVIEYVNQYNQNHVRVQYALQTNGFGMNEEWAAFFAKHHFLIGVSMDGLPEIHDKYRHSAAGGPTYERVINATKLLDKYGVDYNILTVVHREVAENIEAIYETYKKNGWAYLQFITCLDPLGEPRGTREYSLTPEIYGNFMIKLCKLWIRDLKEGFAARDAGKDAYVPWIRTFENYVGIMLGYRPESCEQCGACSVQYVVEADGSVYPCDFYVLDEHRMGNLNTDRLPVIDEKGAALGHVERSLPIPDKCQQCPYYDLCRNGCYRSRVFGESEMTPPTEEGLNYFCESYKMFFDACMGDLEEAKKLVK